MFAQSGANVMATSRAGSNGVSGADEWSGKMFIRSKRLFLRPGWPEDWTELYTAINDEGVVRNLASAPWP